MKLTKQTLKQIIKEELNSVLGEMMIAPQLPAGISDRNVEKIHALIDSNDPKMIKQARALVDAITGSSKYVDDYMDYQNPAQIERTAAMVNDEPPFNFDEKTGLSNAPEGHKTDSIFDYMKQREKFIAREMSKGNTGEMDSQAYEAAAQKWNDRIGPLLKEGIINQMTAEKILRDEFFRVKELRSQGKATDEEVRKAYNDMTNLDTSQFYTDEELASFEAEKAQRDIDDQASIDREIDGERAAERRLDQDRMDYLRTAKAAQGGKFQTPGPDGEMNVRGIGATIGDEGPEPEIEAPDFRMTRAGPRGSGRMSESLQEDLIYEGNDEILEMFENATLEEGGNVCGGCLFEQLQEASCGCPDLMGEAEYQGKKVTLNKPTRGDVKKFKVYVKDPSTGNIKKVNFGHGGSSAKAKGEKTMKIRKNNPKARKSFRARHNCDNPGPKTKARYWSCKKW